ncbi:Hypp674 [Branchiostoma lanceolatum]|uniref:Hypp674 protein n=1 Tax=Branchiostoma lanceolatum TaxID=7740 RepID=A0A8J9VND9_BRALA|nr:Hypp674 [Branchiostoma lanceolatum]
MANPESDLQHLAKNTSPDLQHLAAEPTIQDLRRDQASVAEINRFVGNLNLPSGGRPSTGTNPNSEPRVESRERLKLVQQCSEYKLWYPWDSVRDYHGEVMRAVVEGQYDWGDSGYNNHREQMFKMYVQPFLQSE